MRSQSQYWIGVVTLGLLLCASVHARHVVTLTDENFDELTADGKWLLELYVVPLHMPFQHLLILLLTILCIALLPGAPTASIWNQFMKKQPHSSQPVRSLAISRVFDSMLT